MDDRSKYTQTFEEESAELVITFERTITEVTSAEAPPRADPESIQLTTVRTAGDFTWRRDDIYGDAGC